MNNHKHNDAIVPLHAEGARILIFDIETSPYLVETWATYEGNALEVVRDQYILSFSYKWLGDKDVQVVTLPDFKAAYRKDPTNDAELIKALWGVLDEADIVVAHNGVKFDVKKANARFIKHGLTPPTPYAVIDTLKIARRYFSFPSNRLAALGEYFGLGTKVAHEGYGLWKKCMAGDAEAWKTMRDYNARDVELLEQVYLKLRSWADNHPNVGANVSEYDDSDCSYQCPVCASSRIERGEWRRTTYTMTRRVRCKDCGSWSKGKQYRIKPKQEEADTTAGVTEE